ncbi:hypothetical protein [Spiroplasma clarkii]|nr:hypothetical protein [Spiroplasma clarkii]
MLKQASLKDEKLVEKLNAVLQNKNFKDDFIVKIYLKNMNTLTKLTV